jgi:hypothetical protein
MEPLNTSTDQIDSEFVSMRRKSRWIAPLLLLASILLAALPDNWRYTSVFSPILFLAFVFLALSIVWGILAGQRIFVGVVVATIACDVGLVILINLPHGPRHEIAAVATLRTINVAQITYLSSSKGTFGTMTDLIAAKLLDDAFARGTLGGYNYSITLDSKSSVFTAEALPVSTNTGRFGYYIYPDGIVRYSTNTRLAPAGQSGRPIPYP